MSGHMSIFIQVCLSPRFACLVALLTFIRGSQWAACSVPISRVLCTCLASCLPCWASLSVLACHSQLVEISEVIKVLIELSA